MHLLLRPHPRHPHNIHLLLSADEELRRQRRHDRHAAVPRVLRERVDPPQGRPGAPGGQRRGPRHGDAPHGPRGGAEARGAGGRAQEALLHPARRDEEPVPRLGAHAAASLPHDARAEKRLRRVAEALHEDHPGHDRDCLHARVVRHGAGHARLPAEPCAGAGREELPAAAGSSLGAGERGEVPGRQGHHPLRVPRDGRGAAQVHAEAHAQPAGRCRGLLPARRGD
mmetsp:Transcript_88359/g.274665  ORF Transcript_88359/g.274665 Transcript_88359/m.274665 type:complete len:226 (+) Transcript_88359:471-1148(+)